MPLFEKIHGDHETHLCGKVSKGTTINEYKTLVQNAKFLCKQCGRVANIENNLCEPLPLD